MMDVTPTDARADAAHRGADTLEERLSAAEERVETIAMWVRIMTRHDSRATVSPAARARLLEAAR